jgi:hypothetical protein
VSKQVRLGDELEFGVAASHDKALSQLAIPRRSDTATEGITFPERHYQTTFLNKNRDLTAKFTARLD